MTVPVSTTPPSSPQTPALLLGLLVAYFALQPLSTDLYVPSLPYLPAIFSTDAAHIQLTLTLFLASLAITQLISGPLTDRFGRKPVVLCGLFIYTVASLLCALAPNLTILLIGRVLQGLGTCTTIVCGRAIVRDLFPPQQGAQVIARATMWMALVPLCAPILGGTLQAYFSWRIGFFIMALFALPVIWLTLQHLRETHAHSKRSTLDLYSLLSNYLLIFQSPVFRACTAAAAASYGTLFTFIAAGSTIFIQVLHLSAEQFGYCFALGVLGYLAGAWLCPHWIRRHGLRGSLYRSTLLATASCTVMLLLAIAGSRNIWAILLPHTVFMFTHGITAPTSQACAVSPFPEKAGTAAALMGFLQLLAVTALAIWVGISLTLPALTNSVYPLVSTMAICSWLLALIVFIWVRRLSVLANT